jgi:hypothetical protein
VEVLVCKAVENVQVLEAEKKSAWTDLDRVNFEKKISKSQCSNQKIGVDRSRESQKKASSAASVFKMFISTTGHGSAFDKRCNSRYTLRGCVLADVQSREEFKDALAS